MLIKLNHKATSFITAVKTKVIGDSTPNNGPAKVLVNKEGTYL